MSGQVRLSLNACRLPGCEGTTICVGDDDGGLRLIGACKMTRTVEDHLAPDSPHYHMGLAALRTMADSDPHHGSAKRYLAALLAGDER